MSHLHSKTSGHLGTTNSMSGTTRSCCHCGTMWEYKPGSGTLRGWCQNCQGFVCGANCSDCVPLEQKWENEEQGKPLDFKPVSVYVPPGIDDVA